MRFLIFILFVSLALNICHAQVYIPTGLRKIDHEEHFDLFKNKIFPTNKTIYKDTLGILIENISTLDPTETFFDYYVNEKNEIIECIVRKITNEDRVLHRKKVDFLYERDWGTITPVKSSCQNLSIVLKQILTDDQNNGRNNNKSIDIKVDKANIEKVIGIIESCGFPTIKTVGKDGMSAIFHVIQHGPRKVKETFFPMIKQSAIKGDLTLKEVALMEDRLLMSNREKQKYGTQFVSDNGVWKLYPVEDPQNINQLRKAIGLNPIEEDLQKMNGSSKK